MRKEILRRVTLATVLWIVFGCSFPQHRTFAQNRDDQNRLQPVQGLAVYDANGKRVGNIQGFFVESRGGTWGGAATVAFRFDGVLVILYVGADGFTGEHNGFTQNGNILFESSNCTGTPFMSAPSILLPSLAPRHILQGTKLYRFEGSPRTVVLSSRETLPGPSCDSFSPQEAADMQPLRFLTDLADHFQPPFTLR